MLAGMTSSEFEEWRTYYRDHFFEESLIDAHFAALNFTIVSLVCGETALGPGNFSLLSPVIEEEPDDDVDDETIMSLAESVHGGVRYGPDVSR